MSRSGARSATPGISSQINPRSPLALSRTGSPAGREDSPPHAKSVPDKVHLPRRATRPLRSVLEDLDLSKRTEQRLSRYFGPKPVGGTAGKEKRSSADEEPMFPSSSPKPEVQHRARRRLVRSTEPDFEVSARQRASWEGALRRRHRFCESILRDEAKEQMIAKYRKDLAAMDQAHLDSPVSRMLLSRGSSGGLQGQKAFRSSRSLNELDAKNHQTAKPPDPDLNDWSNGQLVPGVAWRRQRQIQLAALLEARRDADKRQRGIWRERDDSEDDNKDDEGADAQATADNEASSSGKGRGSLLATIDLVASGLHNAGFEDLSEQELARRIPPEINAYEDLFKKILHSAEILVSLGAEPVKWEASTFRNGSIMAAQDRVDVHHREAALHGALAEKAAEEQRQRRRANQRQADALRVFKMEDRISDISGRVALGAKSRTREV